MKDPLYIIDYQWLVNQLINGYEATATNVDYESSMGELRSCCGSSMKGLTIDSQQSSTVTQTP